MKINKAVKNCKGCGQIILFNDTNEDGEIVMQWLSDGKATYPLFGFPLLAETNIYKLFDIDAKQQEKIHFSHCPLPANINFCDSEVNEKVVEQDIVSIVIGGDVLQPVTTQKGILFVKAEHLSPLADCEDYLTLYERTNESGLTYIVAKNGFMVVGVILPHKVTSEKQLQALERITKCVRADVAAKNMKDSNAQIVM